MKNEEKKRGKEKNMSAYAGRVKVSIKNTARYAYGCANSLQGKTGQIVNGKTDYDGEAVSLVSFDTPAKPWWNGQRPIELFWVPASDLTAL